MSVNQKMTAIADAIRDKTGGTAPLTLDDMAAAVPEVFEAGKSSEHSEFWKVMLQDGKRSNYRYAFGGFGWTDKTFNPPITIFPGDSRYMFTTSGITTLTSEQVDFDDATDLRDCFYCCTNLETLVLKITGSAKTFDARSFQECNNLTNLTIIGEISKNGLNLQWSTKLTHDSLMSVINSLTDKSNDTSGTVWSVTLGETNIAKLTDADQEIANNKGWELG